MPGAYDAAAVSAEQTAIAQQRVEAAKETSARAQPLPSASAENSDQPARPTVLSTPVKVAIGVGLVGALVIAGIAIGKA